MTWYNINNIHDTCKKETIGRPLTGLTIILNVEPEQNYIPVLDHVILTLAADKSLLLRGVHVAQAMEPSSKPMTSARMNPRSKSEKRFFRRPAVKLFVPLTMVHARTSFGPAVR